ncbi:CaiB/BaiF CoA transferase family protein [Variovorax paradoxus]|jgi:alpha-methylacyl-CoA racemase|uniref:CoA transferase n=1 Tax=Variovorax paradoxus TaxID=34073 RepID=A0A6I6H6L6_VARPD|nr:CaiB/BaiF CoA-transferase family protein [Variovorax paradoxus]QGW82552.1 CoA transferase [Variovorax paradoxus]
METTGASRPPLAGIRVLDLTRLLPGPVCTLHLADLGAEVLKIEDTGLGDYAAPALRAMVQRNKKGMRLDLKQADGVALLHRLAESADVLVEGFRPGVMDRLGVGYAALSAVNPRLVYCSITGFGQTGPYRDEPGHDLNYCALSGVSDQIGRDDAGPALSNLPIADLLGGSMNAVMGILAALFDAARTGTGRHVDISMADGVLAHALVPLVTLATQGATRRAGLDKLSGALPCYAMYRTQDGRHLSVGALEHKFWERFCDVLGRPDLKPMHMPPDRATAERVRADVAALIEARPLAYWADVFHGRQCCVTPVLRLEEALAHENFIARGMVHPRATEGGAPQLACPVKMTGFEFSIERPAPSPGQDTDEVLAALGHDEAARADLRRRGVVG